jgi:phosphohistidine phosphatase
MTLTLAVLRHAKSSWDEPVPDHERPLAPRGRRALPLLEAHLRQEQVRPDLVLCSSARRALDTLAPLRPALGDPETVVEDDLYGASALEIMGRLRRLDASTGSVMVVGHNPGLHDLVVTLAGSGDDLDRVRMKFPTAALATIVFELWAWSDLVAGRGRLATYVRPRDLPRS